MTSTAPINGLLVAGGVAVAAAVWAVAIFLPAPLAGNAPAAIVASATKSVTPEFNTPEPATPEPLGEPGSTPATAALEVVPEIVPLIPAAAAAPIDPAIFGALQMSMAPPAPAPRASILDVAGTVPLTSMALASPLQSIGATFGDAVAGVGPELGGASPLDGPADSGLDVPVARSDEAEMASATAPPPPRGKIIVLDASEGTKIDPLRQRNWDLNAVQVIPAMPTSAPPRR